jgi:amino acid transporter
MINSPMNINSKKIGLKEAVSIGIGGMVGGGIFAVLGLAVALGGGGFFRDCNSFSYDGDY